MLFSRLVITIRWLYSSQWRTKSVSHWARDVDIEVSPEPSAAEMYAKMRSRISLNATECKVEDRRAPQREAGRRWNQISISPVPSYPNLTLSAVAATSRIGRDRELEELVTKRES